MKNEKAAAEANARINAILDEAWTAGANRVSFASFLAAHDSAKYFQGSLFEDLKRRHYEGIEAAHWSNY